MKSKQTARSINILLVEDNEGDVRLAREALKDSKISNDMFCASDGEEAMSLLRGHGRPAGMPRPDLILLDLNLPRKDGREVLAEIKNDPDLKMIPVVILTTSESEEDVLKTYSLHANCYITKPIDLDQFMKVVQAIEEFWFSIVMLPPNTRK